jgi:glycosyltransferase involved in cell wall biosynthesis
MDEYVDRPAHTHDITVITPTCNRASLLRKCIEQFRAQKLNGITAEHLIILDGSQPEVETMCRGLGVRYIVDRKHGCWGGHARDVGIAQAGGEFLVFWDDDNLFYPRCLETLYHTAKDCDIGVCSAIIRDRRKQRPDYIVPAPSWDKRFQMNQIDSMCVAVRTSLGQLEKWYDFKHRQHDWNWLHRLQTRHRPRINYRPTVVGIHL